MMKCIVAYTALLVNIVCTMTLNAQLVRLVNILLLDLQSVKYVTQDIIREKVLLNVRNVLQASSVIVMLVYVQIAQAANMHQAVQVNVRVVQLECIRWLDITPAIYGT